MKKLLFIFFILLATLVQGRLYKTYYFQTEDNVPGTDVMAIWVTCSNQQCSQIVQNPTSDLWSPNPKKRGAPPNSQQSVSGFPKSDTYRIYAGTIHNFQFLWQTSKNTQPGYYTITMTSTVPDPKCDQSNMQAVTKSQVVQSKSARKGMVWPPAVSSWGPSSVAPGGAEPAVPVTRKS